MELSAPQPPHQPGPEYVVLCLIWVNRGFRRGPRRGATATQSGVFQNSPMGICSVTNMRCFFTQTVMIQLSTFDSFCCGSPNEAMRPIERQRASNAASLDP